MIAIEITKMPEKCDGCKFEDRFGGCILLNCIGNDYPVEEFDEEWRNARKEGRRLKYCPLKEECELLAERQTEKDHTAVFEECANNSGYKCSRCKARVKIRDVVHGTHKYCYKCGARFRFVDIKF